MNTEMENVTREVAIKGMPYRLVSRRADNGDGWVSQVAGILVVAEAKFPAEPLLDSSSVIHDQAAIIRETYGSGSTSTESLDDLESLLRDNIK